MEKNSIGYHDSNMKKIMESMVGRESLPEKTGPRIAAIRILKGKKKGEFADSISVDRSYYTKVERGEAGLRISNAEILCAIYGVGLNYIYRGDLSDIPEELRLDLLKILNNVLTSR